MLRDMFVSKHQSSSLVTSRTDAAGASEFTYDDRGRLHIYTPPAPSGWTVEYEYYNTNEKTDVKVKNGANTYTTTYDYYKNGWLASVDGPAGISVVYTYDAAGKPEKEMYGNNTFAEYAYNNALQLSALKHWKTATPNNVLLVTSEYLRDKVGNPTDMSWDSGSTTTTCTYDAINRLTGATYPGPQTDTFGYDWVGNRNDSGWQTNDVDQLTASPSNTYEYDPHYGNLSKRIKNSNDTTFEYDDYNLLKKINWPNGNGMNQFLSDAAGNRIRMIGSDGAPTWHFVYDTTAGIPAILAETVSNGAPKLYIRTPDGRLVAQAHIVSGSPVLDHYYHFDALGSTKALTNSSGAVTDEYSYDVWGNVTHDTGTAQQPYLFVGQLGYYTHYQEPLMSPFSTNSDKYPLLQLGVRYYAPEIGRFTQRDRIAVHGISRYAYADDDPLYQADPRGLRPAPHDSLLRRIDDWKRDCRASCADWFDRIAGGNIGGLCRGYAQEVCGAVGGAAGCAVAGPGGGAVVGISCSQLVNLATFLNRREEEGLCRRYCKQRFENWLNSPPGPLPDLPRPPFEESGWLWWGARNFPDPLTERPD